MQVRIGVQSVPKELVVETSLSADEVERAVHDAVAEEGGVFLLRGRDGARVVVPADKLAYVEIAESEQRSVGFGSY
ncbi:MULTISPECIES: DUF3107 domain-containing protein [Actinoallomurus]|uniref:DUF3107 domain-containing protein n=1 Tax=Actinoallomurus TaxID=667113 RepID=UPI0020918999|nr:MULTISPECIES: DUF3107 family protein [Actinoallomurus]MCO5971975.1 DUF3107 domain-containing protein [Actinoallomurus soli]MCO5992527.1 DUF3107 domain-containing protein [Actinoallomurus rhizosphaericola]